MSNLFNIWLNNSLIINNSFKIDIIKIEYKSNNDITIDFMLSNFNDNEWKPNNKFQLNYNFLNQPQRFFCIKGFGIINLELVKLYHSNICVTLDIDLYNKLYKRCYLCHSKLNLDYCVVDCQNNLKYCSYEHLELFNIPFNSNRFDPKSTLGYNKLNVLIIQSSHLIQNIQNLFIRINFYKTDLFNNSEYETRNPFLIFNPDNQQKLVKLSKLNGHESQSWNVPYIQPLLPYLYLLEFSYYLFLYNDSYQKSIYNYMDIKSTMRGSLKFGLDFFYNLQKLILMNSTSDIKYLIPIIGSIKKCIKLIAIMLFLEASERGYRSSVGKGGATRLPAAIRPLRLYCR